MFSHNMADMDFGFRVRAAGFALLLAPGLLGTCTLNRDKSRWSDPTLSPVERLRRVRRFDGLPPREWWVFTRRHGGVRWARHFVAPYLRAAAAGPAARWSDRHERRLVGLPQADEGHA
jgi:GT2 family glycosyltransferase